MKAQIMTTASLMQTGPSTSEAHHSLGMSKHCSPVASTKARPCCRGPRSRRRSCSYPCNMSAPQSAVESAAVEAGHGPLQPLAELQYAARVGSPGLPFRQQDVLTCGMHCEGCGGGPRWTQIEAPWSGWKHTLPWQQRVHGGIGGLLQPDMLFSYPDLGTGGFLIPGPVFQESGPVQMSQVPSLDVLEGFQVHQFFACPALVLAVLAAAQHAVLLATMTVLWGPLSSVQMSGSSSSHGGA